jgi:NAD(P)-dependent dehydrogenase (short-subunit alcohol dehydrogenase family)
VIHETGRKVIRHPGDIGSLEYAKTLVALAIQELGRLDIVVNNAGFQMTHNSIEESRRRIRAYVSDQRLRNVLPDPGGTAKVGGGRLDSQHDLHSGI